LESLEILVNSATCYKNNSIIFSDINISLKNSEIIIIMGPNGCGKTTLIKSLSGIQGLESGTIKLNNRNICSLGSDYKDEIIYIGHGNSLNKDLTVIENIEYFSAFDSTININNEKNIKNSMKILDIEKYRNYKVSDLSEGNKKKLSLIRILLTKKKIWFLDEPMSSLDDKSINKLIKIIVDHQKNNGLIFLATHYNFSEKINNCKLYIMKDAKLT
tara:strand:- start:1427 stop:2074 length:648 start_codon:yes stop_codon:yes gene_type:complete